MRELKINLGCGLTNKKEGYLNIDIDGGVDPDITADIRIIPWIWVPNGIVTLIEMNNVLEHFKNKERLDIIIFQERCSLKIPPVVESVDYR